jgi:hypothetical protein
MVAHIWRGLVPFVATWQVPVAEQVWQASAQGMSQQTLSAQLPLWHVDPVVQAVPLGDPGCESAA